MVKGLFTAYTGMINEQHRMDVLTNNLANASTVGYKRERDTTEGRIKALRGSEAVLAAKNEHLSEYNTKLEERKAEVIQEGQAIVRENQQLKAVNEQLRKTDASLREQVKRLQDEVDSLTMQLGQLQLERIQLQAETERAKADRAAALEAAQEMEKHQRELFDRQNSRLVREFGTLPAQKEKKGFRGQVTQEARPECVIVAKEDLERVQDQARYNINVHLTEATIKALDKKISQNEIIQGLQTQVQQQHMELLHLRGENSRLTQQKQRDDWTIEQMEQTLGLYGIASPIQEQHQHRHHRQR